MAEELAKKQPTEVATIQHKRGLEEPVDSSELIIPRVMLIQNTPPKTVTVDRKTCPPGTLINSLTASPLQLDDKDGVPFIPIIRGVKWIRFNAQDETMQDGSPNPMFNSEFEAGAKIWESRDPNDARVKKDGEWGANGEPPLATKFIEFLILIPTESMPLVVGFAKTSFKAGKQLTSLLQFSKKPDIFSEKFRLFVKEEKNDKKQSYYVMTIVKIGDASEAEHAEAEAIYKNFVGREIKVHGEEDVAEPVATRQPWE